MLVILYIVGAVAHYYVAWRAGMRISGILLAILWPLILVAGSAILLEELLAKEA